MSQNYGDVFATMQAFLNNITLEKQASSASDPAAKMDNRGKEMTKDKDKEDTMQVPADSAAAENKDGKAMDPKKKMAGTETYDADQKVSQATLKVSEHAKQARAEMLGNAIKAQLVALQKNASAPKAAAPAPVAAPVLAKTAEVLQKEAAERELADQYHRFCIGWNRGIEKKAEDIKEVMDSKLVKTAAEAEALLDQAAQAQPESVLPEEAVQQGMDQAEGGAAGGMDLDALAEQLKANGVTEQDLQVAAQEIEKLMASGVAPEEIVQAILSISGGAPAGGAAPEGAAPMMPEGMPPEMAKAAAERQALIQDYIRSLKA